MRGFQKPRSTPQAWSKPRVAIIRDEIVEGEAVGTCSCGWIFPHPRAKVREEAAARHLAKRHDGSGIWM